MTDATTILTLTAGMKYYPSLWKGIRHPGVRYSSLPCGGRYLLMRRSLFGLASWRLLGPETPCKME